MMINDDDDDMSREAWSKPLTRNTSDVFARHTNRFWPGYDVVVVATGTTLSTSTAECHDNMPTVSCSPRLTHRLHHKNTGNRDIEEKQ